MFEREIRDAAFVPRWCIVRKLRVQSVAEHQYFVAMYANDLCVMLGVDEFIHKAVLQYSLWHDTLDEIITGDMPGPSKRALIADRVGFKEKLAELSGRIFGNHKARSGWLMGSGRRVLVEAIVKCADWIDAAMEMATEMQLGNCNVQAHLVHDANQAVAAARLMVDLFVPEEELRQEMYDKFTYAIRKGIDAAASDQSMGPLICDPEEEAVARSLGLIGPGVLTPVA